VEPSSEELSIDVFEPVEEASQTAPTVPPPGMLDAASAAADEPAEARPVAMPLEAPVPTFAPPTFAPEPPAPLTLPPETTTSVPLVLPAAVLATPLTVTTPLAGAARPRRPIAALGLGLAGFAAIALAATTWWIATRGPVTAGPATRAGVEAKVEASSAPHGAAVTPPSSAAVLAPVPPPAESIATPEKPAALAQPAAPVNAPPVVPAAPAPPRFTPQPVPARPRPAAVRRGYDPQGI
jgi:hypothetical protein